MKKNKKKLSFGFITLGIGIICLIATFVLYKVVKVDDVFCVILMTFSFVIGIYGVFQIIRDAYN